MKKILLSLFAILLTISVIGCEMPGSGTGTDNPSLSQKAGITVEEVGEILIGEKHELDYTLNLISGEVTFESSNKKIAIVDAEGVVTAVAKGTAVITITCVTKDKTYDAQVEIVVVEEEPVHEHVACPECGKCTAEDCDGAASEKCAGHEPVHEHVACPECGKCTAEDCDGAASEKCAGHEPVHEHVACPECGKCTAEDCDGAASEKCQGHEPVVGTDFTVKYELNGGSWSWVVTEVTNAASGIDAISNLPEIFMADFYQYLFDNDLLKSSKVAEKLHVSNWAQFSTKQTDPIALYNNTSTGGYGAADGYSELFFDSVNGYEAVGGFLGTSPYKEKYANLTKHAVQMTVARYSMETTAASFKAAMGFVLDGYFYGTQGLLADSKPNYETFNALRSSIPTPTVGYVGSESSTNVYEILTGKVGSEIKLVAPVKEGHVFLGWYANPELTGEKVTTVSKECTVYAAWLDLNAPAPVYNINYVLNGGTNAADAPYEFTFGEGVSLLKPTKDGYIFVGWSTDAEGKELITEVSYKQDKDITVYANWIEEPEEPEGEIVYVYEEGTPEEFPCTSLEEMANVFWKELYEWSGSTKTLDTFKSEALAKWKAGAEYSAAKVYKQAAKGEVVEGYFVQCEENYDRWIGWMNAFDTQVNKINASQTAWGSTYVGYLRLYALLQQSASYWTAERNAAVYGAISKVSKLPTTYTPGTDVEIPDLIINDGRTFLGWYDENGNKVTSVGATHTGVVTLTAKWSESIHVEKFTVTQPDKILLYDSYQLVWSFEPANTTNKRVTFKVGDSSIISITEKGVITTLKPGKTTITVEVADDSNFNVTWEIEVYFDPFINGSYAETSIGKPGDLITLNAETVGITDALVWKSLNEAVATVNNGVVTCVAPGYAEIEVSCASNPSVKFVYGITVESGEESALDLITESHNSNVYIVRDLNVAFGAYYTDVIGSATDLYYNYEYYVDQTYRLSAEQLQYGTRVPMSSIEFVTVHYNGMPQASVNGARTALSLKNQYGASYTTCWHYSTGNDGIFQSIDDTIRAAHAGDGSRAVSWTNSGVKATSNTKPVYGVSGNYLTINGQVSKIALPSDRGSDRLTWYGPLWKVVDGYYYITGLHWDSTYKYIGSNGGNMNSIGIESACNEGSDLWKTYHITAQLVANLLVKHNLDTTRVTGHHAYSGKDCPQTLLANNGELWPKFMELVEAEYAKLNTLSGYTISFESHNPDVLDNHGRIITNPRYTTTVSYTVTVKNNTTGVEESATYSSIVKGIYA